MREREKKWRQKTQAEGRKQIACWIDGDTYQALQSLIQAHQLRGMGEAISLLVDHHRTAQEALQAVADPGSGQSTPAPTQAKQEAAPVVLDRPELPGRCECVTTRGERCKGTTKGSITRVIDGRSIEFAACGRHTNWRGQPAWSVLRRLGGAS